MEATRGHCNDCSISVHRRGFAKHLRSKKHLPKTKCDVYNKVYNASDCEEL